METKTVRLGDVANVNPRLPLTKGTVARKIPMEALTAHQRHIDSFFYEKYSGGVKFQNGDTLVARITPSLENGKTSYVDLLDKDEIAFGSTEFIVLRAKNKLILPKFLYYISISDDFRQMAIQSMTGTSGRQRVQSESVINYEFSLPDIEKQTAIVDLLDAIDQKLKINQQINKNLLRLAKQQFNLSFPNVHEGNSRLSNVMENFDRKRIPLARREREKRQGVYRYVGATSVLDYVDDYLFDGTYLLMGEDGTVQDEKGFPILQYIWGKFWPNNHTHVLSGTFVSTEWLYLFLMNTNVRSRITGAVQQKISQANMNSIPLTIPSKDELFRFQKQIEPVFSQIQLLDEQNLKLTAIHKLLLPKLLAGQIDLSNLEGAIQNA